MPISIRVCEYMYTRYVRIKMRTYERRTRTAAADFSYFNLEFNARALDKSIQLRNSKVKYKIFFYWTSSLVSSSSLLKLPIIVVKQLMYCSIVCKFVRSLLNSFVC